MDQGFTNVFIWTKDAQSTFATVRAAVGPLGDLPKLVDAGSADCR
ncbi:hypothetical protein OJ998_02345 [Solirubrobacter taibaiensis]|nr:hypothetical protein [Solirubrobacter taibaiensis]